MHPTSGIIVFFYTNPIILEIAATLRPEPAAADGDDPAKAAYRPMRKALLVAYAGQPRPALAVSAPCRMLRRMLCALIKAEVSP